MKSPAGIPSLKEGVALGEPPRRIHPLLCVMVLLGNGQALLAVLLATFLVVVGEVATYVAAAAAIAWASWALYRGTRDARLLAHGRLARGALLERRRSDDGRIATVTFRYPTSEGVDVVVTLQTREEAAVTDDDEEPLLYDPADPKHVALLDALPGRPCLDDRGRLAPVSRTQPAIWLALTLLELGLILGLVLGGPAL